MLLRRCAFLSIEPTDQLELNVNALLSGGLGLAPVSGWCAHAPHQRDPIPLDLGDLELLGRVSDVLWMEDSRLAAVPPMQIARLLTAGLLVSDAPEFAVQRAADDQIRHTAWFGPSAQLHARSRWEGVDSRRDDPRRNGSLSLEMLAARYGPIPPHFHSRSPADQRIPLPASASDTVESLLADRVTCRNFDLSHALPLADLAQVLGSVFGSHGLKELAKDSCAVKKRVPSGGGLHPLGAYLIVQRVEGLVPGLYHYHVGDHALEPIAALDRATARDLGLRAVAGQEWFADAPVQIVLAARFLRNFWKYRNHAKAYRVLHLDAGHLSQTLYLVAGQMGYGAFITAAINEIDLEQALGLDGMQEGPLAVLGFGARAERLDTVEFDPQGTVWNADGSRCA